MRKTLMYLLYFALAASLYSRPQPSHRVSKPVMTPRRYTVFNTYASVKDAERSSMMIATRVTTVIQTAADLDEQ